MLMAVTPSSNKAMKPAAQPSAERRCLVSGETKAKEQMIRFVIGPDNCVVPDVTGKLPGRGLWVSADRVLLNQAISKNLFSRAAKAKVAVPADLLALVQNLLTKRCLDLLGLAKSAGAVVTGQPQIEEALAKGALSSVLFAMDAGRDCRKKLSSAKVAATGFARDSLGGALGHEHLAAVGLKPHPLTKKLEVECARWQGVSASEEIIN